MWLFFGGGFGATFDIEIGGRETRERDHFQARPEYFYAKIPGLPSTFIFQKYSSSCILSNKSFQEKNTVV